MSAKDETHNPNEQDNEGLATDDEAYSALREPRIYAPSGPASGSKFFQAPREIRDLIYHHLWLEHKGVSASDGVVLAYEDYPGSSTPLSKLPTWLMTSKTILAEGLEQLHRKTLYLLDTRQEIVMLNRYLKKTLPRLLFPLRPSDLVVKLTARLLRNDLTWSVSQFQVLLLLVLVNRKEKLRSIRLFVKLREPWHLLLQAHSLDLSWLAPLKGIAKNVEIHVQPLSGDDVESYIQMQPCSKDEARRTARAILGGGEMCETFDLNSEEGKQMGIFKRASWKFAFSRATA